MIHMHNALWMLNGISNNILAISWQSVFIVGGNQSTRKKKHHLHAVFDVTHLPEARDR